MKDFVLFLIAAALIVFFVVFHIKNKTFEPQKTDIAFTQNHENTANTESAPYEDFAKNVSQEQTSFKINDPLDFNYKTRAEIYEIRKRFVQGSLFKNPDYEPNGAVFGEIVDKKPWASLDYMYSGKGAKNEGVSEESRWINNPTALVMIEWRGEPTKWIERQNIAYLPEKIVYNKSKNEIEIFYNAQELINNAENLEFLLNGINARDLGYHWVYAYDISNVSFNDETNPITMQPYRFLNFIHLGMAWGIEGGANNGSPRQPPLESSVLKSPAHIKLKLWAKQPENPADKEDIKVSLYFTSLRQIESLETTHK